MNAQRQTPAGRTSQDRAPQERLADLIVRRRTLDAAAGASPQFAIHLRSLRLWQSARLAKTYEDFREDPRFAAATEFFLTDLYGPEDFPERNRDLERAWRHLKRALPQVLMSVLENAIELEVLTLEFDHAMVHALGTRPLDAPAYAAAYGQVNNEPSRLRQIDLILGLGEALNRVVRRAWIGPLLQAGHIAAHAAGFGALQDFIEHGYCAFRRMGDAEPLLHAIRERETHFMQALLHAPPPIGSPIEGNRHA